MVEKAMFTAEYQNIHDSGKATQGLIVAAEIVSCAKRSIARLDFEGKVIELLIKL